MIFGLSLGSFYKTKEFHNLNKNEVITAIRKRYGHLINALEINMSKEDQRKFLLTLDNFKWLESLKYISYHLLSQRCYSLELKTINILPPLNNIVCHSDKKEEIEKHRHFFFAFKNIFSFENIEGDLFLEFDNPDFKTGKHKYIDSVCFDIGHIFLNDKKIIKCFLDDNSHKIKQIHLSNCINKKAHQMFYPFNKKLKEIGKMIKLKDYPIIIEESFETLEEADHEINFLRRQIYGKTRNK